MVRQIAYTFLFIILYSSTIYSQGWFQQYPPPQIRPLNSVHFVNATTGWAVGYVGRILRTTDGGENWNIQSSGTGEILNSVHFTDQNTGWAVGEHGIILNTTDGGTNWNSQTISMWYNLESVYFTNNNTGWTVGSSGTILKTIDGGINWNSQISGTTNWLTAVSFTDTVNGIVVGENGTILRTTNGGGGVSFIEEQEIDENTTDYILRQNYPNPFNPSTTIKFTISDVRFTTLRIYDVLGNEIATLVNEEKPVDNYEVEFNGTDLPSGIYFYQLRAGSYIETKKMVLLK